MLLLDQTQALAIVFSKTILLMENISKNRLIFVPKYLTFHIFLLLAIFFPNSVTLKPKFNIFVSIFNTDISYLWDICDFQPQMSNFKNHSDQIL